MKKNCNIIRDLLPLYVENLTSEDSNQFVMEHLHSCEECTNILKDMTCDLPGDELPDIDNDDRKLMRKIKHRINNIMFITVLIAVLIGLGLSLEIFSLAIVGFAAFLVLVIGFSIYFSRTNKETDILKEDAE